MNSISDKSIEYGFRDIVTCEKSNNTRISVMELKPKVIVIGSTWYITIKYRMKDLICLIVVLLFCFRSNYSTQGVTFLVYYFSQIHLDFHKDRRFNPPENFM